MDQRHVPSLRQVDGVLCSGDVHSPVFRFRRVESDRGGGVHDAPHRVPELVEHLFGHTEPRFAHVGRKASDART